MLIVIAAMLVLFFSLVYSWKWAYHVGTYEDEHGVYTGEFRGKTFHGRGRFEFSNGTVYDGQWKDGVMEGYGVMTFADGSRYEGNFKDGRYSGHGRIILPDGTVIDGIFEEGSLIEEQEHED